MSSPTYFVCRASAERFISAIYSRAARVYIRIPDIENISITPTFTDANAAPYTGFGYKQGGTVEYFIILCKHMW